MPEDAPSAWDRTQEGHGDTGTRGDTEGTRRGHGEDMGRTRGQSRLPRPLRASPHAQPVRARSAPCRRGRPARWLGVRPALPATPAGGPAAGAHARARAPCVAAPGAGPGARPAGAAAAAARAALWGERAAACRRRAVVPAARARPARPRRRRAAECPCSAGWRCWRRSSTRRSWTWTCCWARSTPTRPTSRTRGGRRWRAWARASPSSATRLRPCPRSTTSWRWGGHRGTGRGRAGGASRTCRGGRALPRGQRELPRVSSCSFPARSSWGRFTRPRVLRLGPGRGHPPSGFGNSSSGVERCVPAEFCVMLKAGILGNRCCWLVFSAVSQEERTES